MKMFHVEVISWKSEKKTLASLRMGKMNRNRSLCDTSMNLSTLYDLHMMLIMKFICGQFENPRWPPKYKMAAAKIQDGRRKIRFPTISPKLYLFSKYL